MTTSHNHRPASSGPAYEDPLTKGLPADRALQAARQILGGPHLSVLATTNADGAPQMSVIFVKPDGDDILFSTIEGRRKTRNMLRDPRVALCVDDEQPPFAFAIIEGTVSISRDLGEMLPLSVAIARRHMGDEKAEQYGRRNVVDGELLLRLHRGRVTAVADISD